MYMFFKVTFVSLPTLIMFLAITTNAVASDPVCCDYLITDFGSTEKVCKYEKPTNYLFYKYYFFLHPDLGKKVVITRAYWGGKGADEITFASQYSDNAEEIVPYKKYMAIDVKLKNISYRCDSGGMYKECSYGRTANSLLKGHDVIKSFPCREDYFESYIECLDELQSLIPTDFPKPEPETWLPKKEPVCTE